jgi:hypothetical protein
MSNLPDADDRTSPGLDTIGNSPEIEAILADAFIEIATARLIELEFQAHRPGTLVRAREMPVTNAADALYLAAVAVGLVAVHGDGRSLKPSELRAILIIFKCRGLVTFDQGHSLQVSAPRSTLTRDNISE